MLFTSGTIGDFYKNIDLCKRFPGKKTTVGIHPCMAKQYKYTEQEYLDKIDKLYSQYS